MKFHIEKYLNRYYEIRNISDNEKFERLDLCEKFGDAAYPYKITLELMDLFNLSDDEAKEYVNDWCKKTNQFFKSHDFWNKPSGQLYYLDIRYN